MVEITYSIVPPTAMSTDSLISPVPLMLVHSPEPAITLQVHAAPANAAGSVSVTETPTASLGPLLVI